MIVLRGPKWTVVGEVIGIVQDRPHTDAINRLQRLSRQ